MKKIEKSRKLALNKTTLRQLGDRELRRVGGGAASADAGPGNCDGVTENATTCPSQNIICFTKQLASMFVC